MKITKLQRTMLEKIWREMDNIPLQIVADIMNRKFNFGSERVSPEPVEGLFNWKLRKMLPKQLLIHLAECRTLAKIKNEP